MSTQNILTLSVFLILIFLLWGDFILGKSNRVIFMSNQTHTAIYMIPFILSLTILILSQNLHGNVSVYEVILILILLLTYLYISKFKKIILLNAVKEDVVEKMDSFLKENNVNYQIYTTDTNNVTLIAINNYKHAIAVRDIGRWVEIDSNLTRLTELLEKMDDYFKNNAKNIKAVKREANIFFYILTLFLILFAVYFTFYTPNF